MLSISLAKSLKISVPVVTSLFFRDTALKDIESRKGRGNLLYMHAQLTAVPLYKKFDFLEVGEEFLECDIWHVTMQKKI